MSVPVSSPTAAWFDNQLGRQPVKPPAHFSRVLYIPRHDSETTHLPIYETGDKYRSTVGESLLGSSIYTTQLGFMPRPRGEGLDQVVYLADIRRTEQGDRVLLSKREDVAVGSDIELTITPPASDQVPGFSVESKELSVMFSASFPIAPSYRGSETIVHPYFKLKNLNSDRDARPINLEWQIYPAECGLLCYVLVEQNDVHGDTIWAIYHHFGWQLSLHLGYSEGVLLLPESQEGMAIEGFVVASIMGVLAHLRPSNSRECRRANSEKVKNILRHTRAMFGNRCWQ
ncbi:hypothetical protein BX600DRAFT_500591 [Xylariales sp. PMI_506]|nr:hypothetical protein BX600DRAFT_500591 [Xylariales sp. PMI_506]